MEQKKNGKALNIYELRQNLTEHLSNQQCQNKSRHLNRRYTCEPNISVKNFVPVLRPKSNSEQMVPSKLLLISNRNNNINPLSCPVSEDENEIENDSDSSSSSSDTENNFAKNKKNKLNYIKQNLINIRKNSCVSNKSMENKKVDMEEKINDIEQKLKLNKKKELDDDTFEIDKNHEIFRKHKYSCNIIPNFYKNENIFNNIKRNRINSSTILEILENQCKIEE